VVEVEVEVDELELSSVVVEVVEVVEVVVIVVSPSSPAQPLTASPAASDRARAAALAAEVVAEESVAWHIGQVVASRRT
jgi:hypothetical protein